MMMGDSSGGVAWIEGYLGDMGENGGEDWMGGLGVFGKAGLVKVLQLLLVGRVLMVGG